MQGLKNIIVTGSNKGIGYGIASYLASKPFWNVIMAVRNLQLGQQAKKQILQLHPNAHINLEQLDVSETTSIDKFLTTIKQKYSQVHVLVNNAGVAAKGDAFDSQVVDFTFKTNFYGTIELSQKIIPLLTHKGKIVTLGSTAGRMTYNKITNQNLKERFKKSNITRQELFQLVKQFDTAVKEQNYIQKGWPKWSYGVSKLCINAYHSILAQNKLVVEKQIQVYVCCPGYVKTDMTSHKGVLTIEQGIQTPIYLVELPFEINKEFQGGFFFEKKLTSSFI